MMTLRLCLFALGLASAAAGRSQALSTILFEKAIDFAVNSDDPTYKELIDDLEDGDEEALFVAADGLNATGADPAEAVMIWHGLADGLEHERAAYRLGLHYDAREEGENDTRAGALKYFKQASDGAGEVRQPALYRSAILLVEFKMVARALDHYARCTRVSEKYAVEETTRACAEAHAALSAEIKDLEEVPGGILGHIETFEAASLDGFPVKRSKEAKMWKRAVTNLKRYSKKVRDGIEEETLDKYAFRDTRVSMQRALEDLVALKEGYGGGKGMSDLQEEMVDRIMELAEILDSTHDRPGHAREGEVREEFGVDVKEEGGEDIQEELLNFNKEVKEDLKEEGGEEVKEEGGEDIQEGVQEDVKEESGENVKEEGGENVQEDVKEEGGEGVKEEGGDDVQEDIDEPETHDEL